MAIKQKAKYTWKPLGGHVVLHFFKDVCILRRISCIAALFIHGAFGLNFVTVLLTGVGAAQWDAAL
jgi:hypothetical protein